MGSFLSLIRNEHMKIYKKLGTYIMIAILIALTIIPAIIVKYVNSRDYSENWGDEHYKNHLEELLKDESLSADDRAYYESEIQGIEYRQQNNIEGGSWQEEAASDMFSFYGGLDEEGQIIYDEGFAEIDQFIKNDDWKGYLNYQKDKYEKIIKESNGDSGYEQVVEAIDMRLKHDAPRSADSENWKSSVIDQYSYDASNIVYLEQSLEDKTLDQEDREYIENNLDLTKKNMAIAKYRLENDIEPTKDDSQWGYISDISSFLLFNLIAVFIAIVASGIVAGEFSNGTIKLLLIRPNKRWKILASKYVTLFIFTIEMVVIALIVSYLTGGIFFGFEGIPTFLYTKGGAVMEQSLLARTLFESALNSVPLIIVFTMAFMISTVLKNAGLSIGLSVFLLLTGPTVTEILAQLRFKPAKYLITANWNLIYYFMDDKSYIPFSGMTFTFSLVNVLVYFIAANIITFTVFAKRDVAT